MTGGVSTPKTVEPGKVTGIWWESRAKYEEEVDKVNKLSQTLTEIRERTMKAQRDKAVAEYEKTLEWIRVTIDELIPSRAEEPPADEENKSPEPVHRQRKMDHLYASLSLERYNTLRKTAEPFTLNEEEDDFGAHFGSKAVYRWAELTNLHLDLTGGALNPSTLPNMPNLQRLDLKNCGLSSLADFPTARLPALEALSITGGRPHHPELDLHAFPTFPKLEDLALANSSITTLAPLTSARLPNLQKLYLADNPGFVLSTLPDLPELKELNLTDCKVKTLEHLTAARFPALNYVVARRNPLSSESLPKEQKERAGGFDLRI